MNTPIVTRSTVALTAEMVSPLSLFDGDNSSYWNSKADLDNERVEHLMKYEAILPIQIDDDEEDCKGDDGIEKCHSYPSIEHSFSDDSAPSLHGEFDGNDAVLIDIDPQDLIWDISYNEGWENKEHSPSATYSCVKQDDESYIEIVQNPFNEKKASIDSCETFSVTKNSASTTNIGGNRKRKLEKKSALLRKAPPRSDDKENETIEQQVGEAVCISPVTPNKKTKRCVPIVGPDSPQMKSITRLHQYLEHFESNRDVVKQVSDIISHCKERWYEGQRKYLNLPGAIMESLVKEMDASQVATMYQKSQQYDIPQLPSLNDDDNNNNTCSSNSSEQKVIHKNHRRLYSSCSNKNDHHNKKSSSWLLSSEENLQLAVAYGMHMARSFHKDNDDDHSSSKETVSDLAKSGAKIVASMNKKEKEMFWKYILKSKD